MSSSTLNTLMLIIASCLLIVSKPVVRTPFLQHTGMTSGSLVQELNSSYDLGHTLSQIQWLGSLLTLHGNSIQFAARIVERSKPRDLCTTLLSLSRRKSISFSELL